MLQRNLLAGICLALLLGMSPVHAAPFPSLWNDVGVCDPNSPTHCIAPDASGNVPITGTITASLGGFTPSAAGARMTPFSVTTSDSSGTLPTGAVVVVSNVGTTNPMYCNVNGIAATTSDQLIGANSWFAFTIPNAITTLHCIATGGTTTANGVGGAGLPTGAGGGGSSGGASSAFNSAFPANGTAIGLSDGTNLKNWLAAIALADGVNGNNTGAVAQWLWNGTTYDRARGDATNGMKVQDAQVLAAIQSPLAGVTTAQTSAAASSLVAKASAGSLVSVSGSAVSGSFIMVFNATSAPADGAVTPLKCFGPMSAAGPFTVAWGTGPVLTMSTGITVVSSSTGCFTKTATNAAFLSVEYQ